MVETSFDEETAAADQKSPETERVVPCTSLEEDHLRSFFGAVCMPSITHGKLATQSGCVKREIKALFRCRLKRSIRPLH